MNSNKKRIADSRNLTLAILLCATAVQSVIAQHGAKPSIPETGKPKVEYSPYATETFPQNVYFGDTHLHTSYSTDAGMTGDTRGPEDAYRLARGETIISSTGLKAKLSRPLDFLVIADHAENLGLSPAIAEGNEELLNNPWGKAIRDMQIQNPIKAFGMWAKQVNDQEDKLAGSNMSKHYWQRSNEISEKYNEPGLFTALIGYEWTAMPGGNNLHRNVIFRDGIDKTSQIIPMSSYDSNDPEDLWKWLDAYEKNTGGKVLAIPHNGNLSNGLMFDDVTLTSKKPIDEVYAQQRMRWEPLFEVTQIKGDSETHPSLSPTDEFADFYTWDTGSLNPAAIKTSDMFPREYAREALMRGLKYEESLGRNPFKFGMVGSTDSHTSIASTEEDNYFGKVSIFEPSDNQDQRVNAAMLAQKNPDKSKIIYHKQAAAGGLAAVWAKENTRESLWDAMARKEVYATTGTRLRVRIFAGWDYAKTDLRRSDFAEHGYNNGVPMGGDLTAAPKKKAPTLLLKAMKDPLGANLDRIQIIKGWVDSNGETHEKIYDVAISDDRKPNRKGQYPAVGNTVDLQEVSYTNTIGDPYLEAYWKDPDFDSSQSAFYYARVIEIPTPNWLAYDAKVYGTSYPKGTKMIHQERAYTTPIWYSPGH